MHMRPNTTPNLVGLVGALAAFAGSPNIELNPRWTGGLPEKAPESDMRNLPDPVGYAKFLALTPLFALFDEFQNLKDGWEGPNSLGPSQEAIAMGRQFVASLSEKAKHPDLSVGGDGEVNVSWRNEKIFVDISFYDEQGGMMFARFDGQIYRQESDIKLFSSLPNPIKSALLVD